MVVLIMVAMFLIFIGISYLQEKAAKRRATVQAPRVVSAASDAGMYLHPSHSFARIISDQEVEVGMDDFSKRAFGWMDEIILPKAGTAVRQGETAWKGRVAERMVSQRIPVDGEIIAVNERRQGDWLLKIKPSRLQENLSNLIQGASVSQWLKMARAKFLMEHAGSLVPAMQDGGELVDGFARHLTDEQWREFCQEFFNCEDMK